MNQNQVNLDHTIITAPIDGIVTQRSVDVGQTVAASMQAPTLFVIAADLTKMQVNANIDEADVGRIRPGQHVTFRVDAYPDRQLRRHGVADSAAAGRRAERHDLRHGHRRAEPELKLKPGMTANVKVEIAKRTDVLRVPNAALRFRPTAGNVRGARTRRSPPEATAGGGRGRGGGAGSAAAANADAAGAATGAPARSDRRRRASRQTASARSDAARPRSAAAPAARLRATARSAAAGRRRRSGTAAAATAVAVAGSIRRA